MCVKTSMYLLEEVSTPRKKGEENNLKDYVVFDMLWWRPTQCLFWLLYLCFDWTSLWLFTSCLHLFKTRWFVFFPPFASIEPCFNQPFVFVKRLHTKRFLKSLQSSIGRKSVPLRMEQKYNDLFVFDTVSPCRWQTFCIILHISQNKLPCASCMQWIHALLVLMGNIGTVRGLISCSSCSSEQFLWSLILAPGEPLEWILAQNEDCEFLTQLSFCFTVTMKRRGDYSDP